MTDVAPPATGTWYDLTATVDNVLALLRLGQGDVDEQRIVQLVPAAARAIDAYIDGEVAIVGPPPPQPVQTALEQATAELYRRQSVGDDSTLLAASPRIVDALDRLGVVYGLLGPLRRRWGVS